MVHRVDVVGLGLEPQLLAVAHHLEVAVGAVPGEHHVPALRGGVEMGQRHQGQQQHGGQAQGQGGQAGPSREEQRRGAERQGAMRTELGDEREGGGEGPRDAPRRGEGEDPSCGDAEALPGSQHPDQKGRHRAQEDRRRGEEQGRRGQRSPHHPQPLAALQDSWIRAAQPGGPGPGPQHQPEEEPQVAAPVGQGAAGQVAAGQGGHDDADQASPDVVGVSEIRGQQAEPQHLQGHHSGSGHEAGGVEEALHGDLKGWRTPGAGPPEHRCGGPPLGWLPPEFGSPPGHRPPARR